MFIFVFYMKKIDFGHCRTFFFSLRLLLTKFKSKDDKVVEEIHWKHMNK